MNVFDLPKPEDPLVRYRRERDELLSDEDKALETDREFYLECLHGKTLRERETLIELRDGLILYWMIYRRLFDDKANAE